MNKQSILRQSILRQARDNRFALIFGTLHWLSTFFLERLFLTVSPLTEPVNYILCKLLLLAALIGFWRLIWRGLLSRDRRSNPERAYLLAALPCLLILVLWLLRYHSFVLVSDELNLYERATRLDSFAYWFCYPSGYYWICGLMLIPHPMGPTFVKLILQALVAGYCTARQARLTGWRSAWLIYVLFLLPFVLDQGISAHRLPTYGMLSLFLLAKLYYDHREGARLRLPTMLLLSAVIGVLAIWRSEGIYLILLGAVWLAVAYRAGREKGLLRNGRLWRRGLLYLLVLGLVALPQLKAYTDSEAGVELRTKPLCGYVLCNMFRNGLTEEMVADERADIEGYLKFETIRYYNGYYGDNNYQRAVIMNGVEKADYETQRAFCDAVKRVVLKHPLIYLKSQWNAWRYTSAQYVADFSHPLTALANLTRRQWLPSVLVLLFAIAALLRRRWLVFWFCCGGLANWLLVFLLMPAAFAKYFYVDYLMGWFLLLSQLCELLGKKTRLFAKKSETPGIGGVCNE